MMHTNFYMHEILTAAGNFYKFFACNIQTLNAVDMIQIFKNFPCKFPNITCNKTLIILIIYSLHGFSIVPPEYFHMQEMFLIMQK